MVFDEIHYMRDPGEGGGGRRNWVIWSGEKWGFTGTLSLNPSPRRERCGMGGDHHPVTRQRALRVPLGNHPQCQAVCRVDLPPAQTGMCIGVSGGR